MGIHQTKSTLSDGLTPICNDCGISLCFDISDVEYSENKSFWDNWKCQDCNGGQTMQRPYPIHSEKLTFLNGKVSVIIVRNEGHPWDRRPGFDHAYFEAETEQNLHQIEKLFEKRFWASWIMGVNKETGKPGGAMYKPHGIKKSWLDSAEKPYKITE
jgi:hypothetical protein